MSKKTPRAVQVVALHYADGDYRSRAITQRARQDKQWGDEASVSVHEYYITTRLRMMRCLWLQSAFLAQGGAL